VPCGGQLLPLFCTILPSHDCTPPVVCEAAIARPSAPANDQRGLNPLGRRGGRVLALRDRRMVDEVAADSLRVNL
jgi:hypothetical protein